MNSDESWEYFEKVVSILEGQICAGASVKRNVHLPVIGSASQRTRQCDVVIEEGPEPRKTISIVEVQKRATKPSINDFNGWVEKLKEVGAQHLICVSEVGFPESIEEKAILLGPTVRLITLQNDWGNTWPLPKSSIHNKLEVVRYDRLNGLQFEGEHVFRVDPINPSPKESPNPHEKIFRLQDGRLISPTDIIDWHLFSSPNNINALPKNTPFSLGVKFQWEWNQGMQYQDFGGTWVYLKNLLISISVFIYEVDIEWNARVYEQIGWGEVAWALRGNANLHGKPFDIIAPLVCPKPGVYYLGKPVILGDHDAFVAFGEKGYKAERYTG
jgi:hypothetical protein